MHILYWHVGAHKHTHTTTLICINIYHCNCDVHVRLTVVSDNVKTKFTKYAYTKYVYVIAYTTFKVLH